jgi:hypothetical protein
MARGGHGLPKVSLGPAMLYPSMPCGWPYDNFRDGRQHSGQPATIFYPLGYPMPYASGFKSITYIFVMCDDVCLPLVTSSLLELKLGGNLRLDHPYSLIVYLFIYFF